MEGIIGKKIGMTSIYSEEGKAIPCTLVEAGPCVVTQIKTEETDGYNAVQIGFDDKREKSATKAAIGHAKKANTAPKRKYAEFLGFRDKKLGDVITAEIFEIGEWVDVTSTSKGNRLRAPGSIGAGSTPSRVMKGMRMAGQTGNKRTTVLNLQVMKILNDDNVLVLKGAVPGAKGSYVVVHK